MLDDMVDGLEYRRLVTLNRARRVEVGFGELGERSVGVVECLVEEREQFCRSLPRPGRELVRSPARVRRATHTADDPLADVTREVQEQVADAVRLLVRAPPEPVGGNGVHGRVKLCAVLRVQI